MKHFWSLMASLALAFGPLPAMSELPPSAVAPAVRQAAFEVACAYTPGCTVDTPMPRVEYAPTLETEDAWGIYSSDDYSTVWLAYQLAPKLSDPRRIELLAFAILVHETVHYLDHQVGGSPVNDWYSVCASEAKAWYVQNDFLVKAGAPELAQLDWVASYPQCKGLVEAAE